jgi:hypothetical protein
MNLSMVVPFLTILLGCAFFLSSSADPCHSEFDSNLPTVGNSDDLPPLFEVVDVGLSKRGLNQRDFTFLFNNPKEFVFDGDGLIHVTNDSPQKPGGKCLFIVKQGETPKCTNLALDDVPTTFDSETCTLIFDGINGKLELSKSTDAIECSNVHLDFSSNKKQKITWTFTANNPTPHSNTEITPEIDDAIPPGPMIWPFDIDITPISTFSSILKFSITNFPTLPNFDLGYEYDITVKLSGVELYNNYSPLDSTVPVHRLIKTTYVKTPVDTKSEWIQTSNDNEFIFKKFQFIKPNVGEATQFRLQFELSTLSISDQFEFSIEVVSTKNSNNQFKFTSQHPSRLSPLVYNSKKVTTTYIPTTEPKRFGFKISLPDVINPLNHILTLTTNATLVNIDSQGLFKPIGDKTCQVSLTDGKDGYKTTPVTDQKSQKLTFNFESIPELSQFGQNVLITCHEWVIELPVDSLLDTRIAYFLQIDADKASDEKDINDNSTAAGVSWVARSINESKNDDKDDKRNKSMFVIAALVVVLIVVAAAVYFVVVLRKKSSEVELIGDDQYHQVV